MDYKSFIKQIELTDNQSIELVINSKKFRIRKVVDSIQINKISDVDEQIYLEPFSTNVIKIR